MQWTPGGSELDSVLLLCPTVSQCEELRNSAGIALIDFLSAVTARIDWIHGLNAVM